MPQLHGIRSKPFDDLLVEHQMELAPVHSILVPAVAGEFASRLAIYFAAIQSHERPFARGNADLVEFLFTDTQVFEFTDGVGLEIDADTQRLQPAHALEHRAGHADLVEREGERQPTDATTGNKHMSLRHP